MSYLMPSKHKTRRREKQGKKGRGKKKKNGKNGGKRKKKDSRARLQGKREKAIQ